MALFFNRFVGALALDAGAYENVEADGSSALQSVAIVAAVCVSGGVAALGLGLTGLAGVVNGAVLSLGAWLTWAAVITTFGTITLPEPQTKADVAELFRVLGFAAAPGVFVGLAAMPAAAPWVLSVVAVWMIAAAVMAVRQALDYKSTTRAIVVCALAWLLTFGVLAAVAMLLTTKVS